MKLLLVPLVFASTLACSQTLTTNGAKHTTVGQTHIAAISSNGFVQTVLPPFTLFSISRPLPPKLP
jgi:hypothetical protein